ncbi:hypothetical protein GF325_00760 [Candidatus Bathyarchaeota archaeon]|nr:hypothetical protein [Candidatus Bathyarchaeota archaeon]
MTPGDYLGKEKDAFIHVVTTRRSYRGHYSPRMVKPQVVEDCINMARWAPSAHNAQPWRFMTAMKHLDSHEGLRSILLDRMSEKYSIALENDGKSKMDAISVSKGKNQVFVQAPVLIIAFLDAGVLDSYPDAERQENEFLMGVQSVAAAIQVLILTLHHHGLASCWYCAPLFCKEIVRRVLHLPDKWSPQAFITAGYPMNDQKLHSRQEKQILTERRRRKNLDEICFPINQFHEAGKS